MSKAYTPGPEADAVVERQLAKGGYSSADEVVRASLQLLEEHESELEETQLEELRRLIAEGDADIAAGRVYRYASADELTADIIARAEAIARGEADSSEDTERLTSSET